MEDYLEWCNQEEDECEVVDLGDKRRSEWRCCWWPSWCFYNSIEICLQLSETRPTLGRKEREDDWEDDIKAWSLKFVEYSAYYYEQDERWQ